jgi:DNA invertase Pin-like site-specific DNA recombinase
MKRLLIPAFAYLRVSGRGQLDGDGFPRQIATIHDYAKKNGFEIVRVFEEQGVSGTKELENRPALQNLITELENESVRVVLVERLDRLARDLMVQETIIGDLQKRGFELVSVHEPDLCSDDPSRKLIRQIFGAIAEYDRAMIVLKLRGARQRMKARVGRCEGRKPYGTFPGESDTLARMTALRAEGASYQHIAHALAQEGRKPRYGEKWNPIVINKVLRNVRRENIVSA